MADRREDSYQVTRVTRSIPRPFSEVLSRVQSSLKRSPKPSSGMQNSLRSPDRLEGFVNETVGPHGFMHFHEIDHGEWLPVFGVHVGKRLLRIIYGNPLVALTMIRQDLTAGLFAPIEVLLVERDDGNGTDVVYLLPSTLIAGYDGAPQELKDAAKALDAKVEKLWDYVAE